MYSEIPARLKQQLDLAPKRPGVYMFHDESGTKLYIGKAVNLYNRSRSYFANYKRLDPRLQLMVEAASYVEYIEVDNEVEALLLETNLIKKYDPHYNVLMTDDKSYIWVKVASNMDFPRINIVRNKKDDGADYFGPYPAKTPIKRLLKNLRKVFPYRSCNRVIEVVDGQVRSSDVKPCLYYHLGLCSAPCTTDIPKEEYRTYVNDLKRFLRADHADLKRKLDKEMRDYSKEHKFEAAAGVRDRLKDLEYLTKFSRIDESVDDEVFAQKKLKLSLEGVKTLIEKLEIDYPTDEESLQKFRIECYDISNIQGTNATSAMVVSVGGNKKNSDYRKFKIKTKSTPDDFAMLQETLTRRLKYLLPMKEVIATDTDPKQKSDASFAQKPDLMVIDGGKGQLSSVMEVLVEYQLQLGYQIPCIGLAKREEEIFVPDVTEGKHGGELKFKLVKLSKRNPALKILQQVRDEAHRFGLGYHRLLRSKGMIYSELELIPGVGAETRKKLILAFGSVAGIKKAKLEDIQSVVKNINTARKIKRLLV